MSLSYESIKKYNSKYPGNVYWRLKKHCKIADQYLYDNEEIIMAFAAQNDNSHTSIFNTALLVLTSERLMVIQDNILIGHKVSSITPDLYNDMQVDVGLIWGMISIDTVKETVNFSNIDKKALPEIQRTISSKMMEAKKKYYSKEKD